MRLARTAAVVTLATLAMSLVAATPGGERPGDDDVPAGAVAPTRVAGPDRVLTAIAMARTSFEQSDVAVLARAGDFPDALTAAYVAGRHDAPILLTRRDRMHPTILDTFQDLGVARVIILGGEAAVSARVEQRLRRDWAVTRIQGTDRFATAAAAARAGGDIGRAPRLDGSGGGELTTAILGTGLAFPDVLAAGPLAYAGGHPVLLATSDALPAATEAAIHDLGIEQVVVVGGTHAVGEGAADRLRELGVAVTRVAGSSRTATAAEVADLTRRILGWGFEQINLARGDGFADALTLAPLAARSRSPVVLTPVPFTIGADAFEQIQAGCGLTTTVVLAGGASALTTDAAREASFATVCADHAVPMSGTLELHDADPAGTGTAHLWLGSSLCYALTVEGIGEATAAHVHHAVPDADGPVAASLRAPGAGGFAAGCVRDADVDGTVAPDGTAAALAQAIQTAAVAYYVNVHTDAEPDGAIRGNLGAIDFGRRIPVTGEMEVEPGTGTFVDDPAPGSGFVELRRVGQDRLCAFLDIEGTDSPVTAAHVHRGRIDENGPAVVPLAVGAPRTNLAHLACTTTDPALLDELEREPAAFYVNVHTAADPAGALRGPVGSDALVALTGAAEVDDTDPEQPRFEQGADALGVAELYLGGGDGDARTACLEATLFLPDGQRLTPPEGADGSVHVHRGHVDENGGILFGWSGFDGQPTDDTGFVVGVSCTQAPAAAAEAVLADPAGLYLNAHTDGFPAGALRGQLGAELSTLATGAQVVGGGDLTAVGTGTIWTGSPANPDVLCGQTTGVLLEGELTDVTLRRGPQGATGPAIASLAGGGDPSLAALFSCVTDADPGAVASLRGDPAGHHLRIDTTEHPDGALRGQLAPGSEGPAVAPGTTALSGFRPSP